MSLCSFIPLTDCWYTRGRTLLRIAVSGRPKVAVDKLREDWKAAAKNDRGDLNYAIASQKGSAFMVL